jgi:hypothetical protein
VYTFAGPLLPGTEPASRQSSKPSRRTERLSPGTSTQCANVPVVSPDAAVPAHGRNCVGASGFGLTTARHCVRTRAVSAGAAWEERGIAYEAVVVSRMDQVRLLRRRTQRGRAGGRHGGERWHGARDREWEKRGDDDKGFAEGHCDAGVENGRHWRC